MKHVMKQKVEPQAIGFTSSQIRKALEFVDYQDGAISNQEVIKGTSGSVNILSFDKGQNLKEHTSLSAALVYVLEGEVEISILGIPHRLQGGDMILVPASEAHALRAITRFKMILTKIIG